jgi:hypothetical protein
MANAISSISENIQYFTQRLLSQLRNELALLGYTSRNFENEVAQPGQTINVNDLTVSGAAKVRTINGAVDVDDMSAVQKQVTLKQIYKAVKVDNLQRTFSSAKLINEAADRLAIILADGADAQLTGLHAYMPYETGEVDGTEAFDATLKFSYLAKALQILKINQVIPRDLQAVFGTTEAYDIRTLDLYHDASKAGTAEQLREGSLGRIYGFNMRESQSTPGSVTVSTAAQWATPLIDNAAGYPIGTTTIHIDGAQASQTAPIKAGSTFLLGGNRYAVTTTSGNTDATGDVDLAIWPPLKTAVADNDPLTPTGHSAAGSVGFAYHPDAFLWIVRPQAPFLEGSGPLSYQMTDAESGLSVRVSIETKVAGAAGTAMQETITADFLCGAGLIRPELAVKVYGKV